MPNEPKHDELIVELIEDRHKLKVHRNFLQPTFCRYRFWLPKNELYVFRERAGRYLPATYSPDPHGYLRVRLQLKVITWHEFWLSDHRISYVARNGPTPLEVDHIDRIRVNNNDWNLRGVDHLENMANQERFFLEEDPAYLTYLEELQQMVFEARRKAGLPPLIVPSEFEIRPPF